jgi:hypothetical protein
MAGVIYYVESSIGRVFITGTFYSFQKAVSFFVGIQFGMLLSGALTKLKLFGASPFVPPKFN